MSINEISRNCCMLNKESKNNLHVNILDLDLLMFDNICILSILINPNILILIFSLCQTGFQI